MPAISTAVNLDRVSAIVGYEIKGSLEGITAGNLPQRIGILAETNTANQSGLPNSINFTDAKEVASVCGYGSPAHLIARILRPLGGDLLGGIPTVIYPVAEPAAGTATAITVAITGTATKTTTHKLFLAGRDQLDGQGYSFVVEKDDGAAEISQKIIDVVNGVLGAPAIGTVVTDDAILTSKWLGITSADMNLTIDQQGESAGITYGITQVDGAGVPDIATPLANMKAGEEWTTLIVNGIGSDSTILDTLEAFVGNVNDKTGLYLPTDFKPAIALFGDNSVSTLAEATSALDARKNEMANAHCPAPNSTGFSFEAPANYAFLYAPIAQNTPQTDPIGRTLNDMPAPDDIGEYADPSKRDQIVKVGGSTVKLNSGEFEIVDFVTTYHPADEPATATLFRWVRNLVGIDWNVKYGYTLLENIYVVGKTIVDGGGASATGTISPDRWKGIIKEYANNLEARALIADAPFMQASIQVQIGESNADRFETTFKLKRTGIARVLSTTAETLFNFG